MGSKPAKDDLLAVRMDDSLRAAVAKLTSRFPQLGRAAVLRQAFRVGAAELLHHPERMLEVATPAAPARPASAHGGRGKASR